jgi:hypothetical protein
MRFFTIQRQRVCAALFLASASLSLSLSSCGNDRKKVYPVHGSVLDKSRHPAAEAFVVFHPLNGTDSDPNKPRAYVKEDGSFQLTTYTDGDGAPAGEYVITIEWKARPKSSFDNRFAKDRLGGRYNKVGESKLRATIEKGKNELPAIVLE